MSELLSELCQLAIRLTNDFKRPISIYRLPNHKIFRVYSYLEPDYRWISLSTGNMNDKGGDRALSLFTTSRQFNFDFIKNWPHKEIFRKSLPGEEGRYSDSDIKNENQPFKILAFFLKRLKEPGLVRVDPYDYTRVLRGEETEADLALAGNCAMVERFEQGLKSIKLKPGIINPWEEPQINN